MGDRAEELASRFEAVHEEVVAFCDTLTTADWERIVPNEERTVGVLFQHIAVAYTAEAALIRAIINGKPLPDIYTDPAILDAANARDAVELLAGTKAEAIASLNRHARRTTRFLRRLADDDLARSQTIGIFGGRRWTVDELISRIVLGHPQVHLASIREALTTSPSA